MKARSTHVIPLSEPVIAILGGLDLTGELVFPGPARPTPVQHGHGAVAQAHRPCRRDGARHEVQRQGLGIGEDVACSRRVGDGPRALDPRQGRKSYRRGDLLAKRKKLMDHSARFLTTPPAEKVVDVAAHRAKGHGHLGHGRKAVGYGMAGRWF